jgi:hypothetical protein
MRSRKVLSFLVLSLFLAPLSLIALPEVDIRSKTGAVVINGLPGAPTAFLQTDYTCPALGRIHVSVTGRLQQFGPDHFQGWFTQLGISRNSLAMPGNVRTYDAPGAFGSVNASDEQDVALTHVATCDAHQAVTYRLMANKGLPLQTAPSLNDAVLVLTYVASAGTSGG